MDWSKIIIAKRDQEEFPRKVVAFFPCLHGARWKTAAKRCRYFTRLDFLPESLTLYHKNSNYPEATGLELAVGRGLIKDFCCNLPLPSPNN